MRIAELMTSYFELTELHIAPRAQGRGYRINKRTSHITVIVSDDTEGGNR